MVHCSSMQLSGRGSGLATSSPAIALEVDRGDVLDGSVAGNFAGDAVRGRAHVGVLVRLVELVLFASDGGDRKAHV